MGGPPEGRRWEEALGTRKVLILKSMIDLMAADVN